MRLTSILLLCICAESFQFQLDILRLGFKMYTMYKGVNWPDISKMKYKYDNLKIFDPSVKYPSYYKSKFHAYEDGNLNWQAAEDCLPASKGVLASHYGVNSTVYIRSTFFNEVLKIKNCKEHQNIIDMGCGIGISTNYIKEYFTGNVVGVDLSPYFLQKASELYPKIKFVHGNIENLDIPPGSQDIVFISYVLHEMPVYASIHVISEASRVLKSGGILAILDMDPNIKASNMFTQYIFDRTEPFLDQYKTLYKNKNRVLNVNGFFNIKDLDLKKTKMCIAVKK